MAEHKLQALIQGLSPWFLNKKRNNVIEGSITPNEDGSIDLGSATKKFANIYADNVVATSSSADVLVKTNSSDPSAGYLNDKLTVASPVTKSVVSNTVQVGLTLTNFLLRDGSQSLQGNLAVDAGITIDGVDIGNPGDGLEISTNRYRINLATNSGLEFATGELQANVGSTMLLTANELLVNEGANFTWTGTHQFNVDPQINANLDFIGGDRSITGSGDITLDPTDDLILSAGGVILLNDDQELRTTTFNDLVTGISGLRLWERSDAVNYWQLTMGAAKFDELYARVFVADETRVDRGEEYWSKSYGIVESDFVLPAIGATVDVWFEDAPSLGGADLFSEDDWILFRIIDWGTGILIMKTWFQVTHSGGANVYVSKDAANDRQQWRLTRKKFGTTGVTVKKGNVGLDAGQPGQGWLHLSALSQDGGPFFQVGLFTSVVSDEPQFTPYTRMGNLDGTIDYSGMEFGFATGSNLGTVPSAGFSGMASDTTNGMRMFNTDIYLYDSTTLSMVIQRDYGVAMLNDDTAFGHDERMVAWYDDLDDLGAANATARIGTWGDTDDRRLLIYSYGSDKAAIFLTASGDGGTDQASISVKAGGWDSVTNGLIELNAYNVLNIGSDPRFRIGGDVGTNAVANLHLYFDNSAIDDTTGFTIEQDGLGDALIHWSLTLGQMFTAGIDNSDGDKWKISAGTSLGGTDYIVIDPIGGTVTITGLTGGSAASGLIGGDGIDITGSTIDVDATVVRTTRSVTAGDGLTGGGNLSADRSFAVDSSVVRTTRTISTSGALAGGGDLSSNRTLSLTLGTNSGLDQTSGLIIASTIAGTGLTLTAGVLSVNVTDGLTTSGDNIILASSVAGAGLAYASGVLSVNVSSGLTTSGDDIILASSVAGSGLAYSTGILSVNVSDGLAISGDNVILASSAAGAGLGYASGVLSVGATNASITVAADAISVNLAHTYAWTGSHTWSTGVFTFNTDLQLDANLDFVGAQSITTTTGDLTISPAGDLELNPTGTDVLPGSSVAIDFGDYNRKWRTLFAAELYVETLVAQDVMATIGGRIMVAPTTKLIADMTNVQTTIDVEDEIFDSGDYILLQTAPAGVAQFESMKVTSTHTVISGGYRYTVTRNLDSSGANTWATGDAVVNLGGAVGEGYIDLTSTSTVHNHLGPNITVYARSATTNWNDVKPVVAMGNLESFVDYSVDEFGFATGNDLTLDQTTGFSGVTIDRTNGLRLFNTDIGMYESGELVASFDRTNGIYFKEDTNILTTPTRYISWYEDIDPTPTNFKGAIGVSSYGGTTTAIFAAQSYVGDANDPQVLIQAYDLDLGEQLNIILRDEDLAITTSASTLGSLFRFTRDGRLGLGVSSPGSRLHVRDGSSATDETIGITVENTSTGDAAMHFIADSVTWSMGIDNSESNNLLKISRSGSIGTSTIVNIGSTGMSVGPDTASNPASVLFVYENTSTTGTGAGLTISNAGTGDAVAQFLIPGVQRWVIGIDNSDGDKFKFSDSADVGSGTIMTLDAATNNVGIGAATPLYRLHLVETSAGAKTLPLVLHNASDTNSTQVGIRFAARADTTSVAYRQGELVLTGSTGVPTFLFSLSDGSAAISEVMRIYGGGSVGIGTAANPGAPLHVAGTTNTSPTILTDNNRYFGGKAAGGSLIRLLGIDSSNHVYIGGIDSTGGASTFIRQSGSDIISIVDGDVGINTTIPGSRFEVYDSTTGTTLGTGAYIKQNSTGDALLFFGVAAKIWSMGIDNSDGDKFKIYGGQDLSTDENDTFTFTDEAYLGIGEDTPGARIHIVNADAAINNIWVDGVTTSSPPSIIGRSANGTIASKTATASGNILMTMQGFGYYTSGGTGYGSGGAAIKITASQTWTSANQGGEIYFETTPNNSTTRQSILQIDPNGKIYTIGTRDDVVSTVPSVTINSSSGLLSRTTHANSSLKYKEDVQKLILEESIELIKNLNPISYRLKKEYAGDGITRKVGFIAEDVLAFGAKDYVQFDGNGQPDLLYYDRFVAPLTQVTKHLMSKIDALEEEIQRLKYILNGD